METSDPMIKNSWCESEAPLEVESHDEDGGDSDTDRELSSSFESDIHLRSSSPGLGGDEIDYPSSAKSPVNLLSTTNSELLLAIDLTSPNNNHNLLDGEDCRGETRSRSSSSFGLTPSSSPSPVGQFTSSSRFNQKRGSLDLTKDHLKSFVSRWTDNPYLFDRPRGIISHLYGTPSQDILMPKKNSQPRKPNSNLHGSATNLPIPTTNHRLNDTTTPSPIKCGMNIVSQIRRFSYQLHEELQIMKSHHHHHKCNPALRKCSWGEVNAQ